MNPFAIRDAVDLLQRAVVNSMNARQQLTTITQQLQFLTTEVGEVVKEDLKRQGCYGDTAREEAEARMATELSDVLWNCLAAAHRMGVNLGEPMVAMLTRNATRKWPGDPLTGPSASPAPEFREVVAVPGGCPCPINTGDRYQATHPLRDRNKNPIRAQQSWIDAGMVFTITSAQIDVIDNYWYVDLTTPVLSGSVRMGVGTLLAGFTKVG